jgi:hypothetical protein
MLRDQRLAGVDELALQRFVAEFGGSDWEEFFEDLFGYEALQRARVESAERGGRRHKRFRPWRDTLIAKADRRLDALRRARDATKLRKIEEQALVAGGMSAAQAAAEADRVAHSMVMEAAQWRDAAAHYKAGEENDPKAAVLAKRARVKAMLAEARSGAGKKPASLSQQLNGPLDMLLGAHVRLILGTLLILGCALWIRQNGVFANLSADTLKAASSALQQGTTDFGKLAEQAGVTATAAREPLAVPIVGSMVSNFNAGIAGVLLVASVFLGGWRASLVALPVAAMIWLGPLWFGLPWLWK